MAISTINQNGLNAPLTLTAPVINTVTSAASTALTLQSAGTTAVTIDTSQNVGIGTTSPANQLNIVASSNGVARQIAIRNTNAGSSAYSILDIGNDTSATALEFAVMSSTNTTYSGANGGVILANNGGLFIETTTAYPLLLGTNGAERMRIDSSGNVLISTTSNPTGATFVVGAGGSVANFKQSIGAGYNVTTNSANNGGTYYHMQFTEAGTQRGSITSNGGSTSYITGSDYRLKDNIAPMINALAKVEQLKPSTWTWKSNKNDGQGFIAHELAEVCPEAVVGEKDAVDEEGKPVYQGVDTSFLVATLTAAIQELNAKVDAQAAEIQALKAGK